MDINAKKTEKRFEKAISHFGRFLKIAETRLKYLVRWAFATLPRRIVSSMLIILLVLLPVSNLLFTKEAKASWWDETWLYRRAIPISNPSGSELTEFQVKVLDGEDLSSDVSAGKIQSDLDDLRFVDQSGNMLPYWIEDDTSASVDIWAKLPIIPTSGATVYMYYGNPMASEASDGDAVFEFFEDFSSLPSWEQSFSYSSDQGTWEISDETLLSDQSTANQYRALQSDYLLGESFVIEYRHKFSVSNSGQHSGINFYGQDDAANNGYQWIIRPDSQPTRIQKRDHGAQSYLLYGDTLTLDLDRWYDMALEYDGSTISAYIDSNEVLSGSFSDESFPSGTLGVQVYKYRNYFDDLRVRKHASSEPDSATPEAEEIGPGPVAYWNFDEGYGTTAHDSSGQGNDGALTNMSASSAPDSGWQTEGCVSGRCLAFDGDDDYVQFSPPRESLNPEFTQTAWIKTNSVSTDTAVRQYVLTVQKNPPIEANYTYIERQGFQIAGDRINAQYWKGSSSSPGSLWSPSGSISANTWYFVAFTGDADGGKLYINGSLVASNSDAPLSTAVNQGFIGRRGDANGEDRFNGRIDEPKIYPYARSAEEIAQDYNAGLAGMGTSSGSAIAMGGGSDAWMTDGLVGYWKMDESSWNGTSGEVTDWSGNGYDGTAVNGATTAAGKFGNGGDFDGTNDYVNMGDVSGYDFSGSFSLSAWIRTTQASGSYPGIVGKGFLQAGTNGYGLFLGGTSGYDIAFQARNDMIISGASGGPVNDGKWHHVVGIRNQDSDESRIYVDGELKDSDVTALPAGFSNTKSFAVGSVHRSSWLSPFAGDIDEVRVYDRALSPDEVRDLYEYAPGPVGHWTFDESEGTTAYDSSGSGNDGTLTNGPTWTNGTVGGALEFDGDQNRYVSLSNAYPDIGTQSWTISTWAKVSSSTTGRVGVILGNFDDSPAMSLEIHDDGEMRLWWNGAIDFYGTTDLRDDTWHYLTFMRDKEDDNLYLYIDGNLEATSIGAGSDLVFSGVYWMGSDKRSGGMPFHGSLDDMRIYDYARTQKQIIEDMNAGNPAISSSAGSAGAYWNFDEGSGTSVHDAWGDNDGTISGATWTNDGRFGKALSFDGSDDYVQIADDDALTFGDGTSDRPFSISSWVNMDDRSQFLISSKASEYRLTNNNHFRLYLYDGNTSNSIYKSGGDLVSHEGRWTHLVATYDGSGSVDGIRLYKDGMLIVDTEEASAGTYVAMENTTSSFQLGDTTTDGQIDEVKIYPYALSEDEVRTEYNRGSSVGMAVSGPLSIGGSSSGAHAEYCPPGNTEGNCASGQDPSPVGEWKFDEGTGTTAQDTSGNGNDGTLENGPMWKMGKVGKALRFDGTNDYVEIDNVGSYIRGGNLSTTSIWVKTTEPNGTFFGQDEHVSNPDGVKFKFVDGTICARVMGSFVCSAETFHDGGWHHTTLVRTATNSTSFYVDGKYIGTSGSGGNHNDGGSAIKIGADFEGDDPGYNFFNGAVDHVKIYPYARTPAQIAWDYNRGKPVAHWKMDECEGGTIHDSSGNGLHGTWSGSGGSQTSVGNCQSSGTAWGNGVDGKFGSSLSFDGTDDYVGVGDIDIDGQEFSISAWISIDEAQSDYQCFISDSWNKWFFSTTPNETNLGFKTRDSEANQRNTANYTLSPGTWYHVVGIAKGGGEDSFVRLYIDGELYASNTGDWTYGDSGSVYVGAKHSGDDFWNGRVDELNIYNYTLSDQQIKLLYNGGASLRFGE